MITIKEKVNCCGCGACQNVCPKQCISMIEDDEGFLYPIVDSNSCINCNVCDKVCPFGKEIKTTNKVINAYACAAKNTQLRKNSSSGAVFSLLAQYVLRRDGVVYGTQMNEDCTGAFVGKATSEHELLKLRGSKYLQSYMNTVYKEIYKNLEEGKLVLFSGTACQVNGLVKYLRKSYDNLICVDVICHGVPSPKLWKKYVAFTQKRMGKKIINVNFRSKIYDWKDYGVEEQFKGRRYYIPMGFHPYMIMFLKNYSLRPSCYKCKAKNSKKSDLTIGDFWGIERAVPEMNDGLGTSLVISRTEKGENLVDKIRAEALCKPCNYAVSVAENPAEYSSVYQPQKRSEFYKDMSKMSFDKLEKKYTPISKKRKIKIWIKNMSIVRKMTKFGYK